MNHPNADGISILNLVSLVGLLAMVGFAWLMSSNRRRISWKLVAMGLGLQLLLAAILFQSQSWTIDGRYPNGILFAAVES